MKTFIERTKNYHDKIVVFTTSDEGSYRMEGVDDITGESLIENVPLFVKRIKDSQESFSKIAVIWAIRPKLEILFIFYKAYGLIFLFGIFQ